MQTLVLALGSGWAELAARHVAGDAIVHIGDPGDYETDTLPGPFDEVVLSGDVSDGGWLSASFDVASRCLGAGGRVRVIVADGDPDLPAEFEAGDATPWPVALPGGIAVQWRVVGLLVEDPVSGILFQRAVEDDGATATSDAFLLAQIASHTYRHLDATWGRPDGPVGMKPGKREPADDPDADLADVRRELAAYKNSTLGRVTTRYWQLRRSIRRRIRGGP